MPAPMSLVFGGLNVRPSGSASQGGPRAPPIKRRCTRDCAPHPPITVSNTLYTAPSFRPLPRWVRDLPNLRQVSIHRPAYPSKVLSDDGYRADDTWPEVWVEGVGVSTLLPRSSDASLLRLYEDRSTDEDSSESSAAQLIQLNVSTMGPVRYRR